MFELDSVMRRRLHDFPPGEYALDVTMGGVNYGFTPQAFRRQDISADARECDELECDVEHHSGPTDVDFLAPHLSASSSSARVLGRALRLTARRFTAGGTRRLLMLRWRRMRAEIR